MSDLVRNELEDKGVGLQMGMGTSQIEEFDNRLRVSLGDASLDVDLVIMGVGVVPNSEIASDAGLESRSSEFHRGG